MLSKLNHCVFLLQGYGYCVHTIVLKLKFPYTRSNDVMHKVCLKMASFKTLSVRFQGTNAGVLSKRTLRIIKYNGAKETKQTRYKKGKLNLNCFLNLSNRKISPDQTIRKTSSQITTLFRHVIRIKLFSKCIRLCAY